jgi:hypothetical protein
MANGLAIAQAFSNIGKGIFGGQKAYDAGYNAMAKTMAEQELLGAKTRDSESQAELNTQKADEIKRRAAFQTPEYGTKLAATLARLPETQGAELENFARTGGWGTNIEALPPDQYGPPQITPKSAPSFATPAVLDRYMAARAATMGNLAGTGNSDSHNMAQAYVDAAKQAQIDQALAAGGVQGLNGLEAARKGDLYKFAEFGTGDQSTGKVAFNQPYLDKNASAIAENRAQAGNAVASAELHRIQATNERGGGKPPPGYRWKADGTMEAIPGGPADLKIQGQFNQDTAALNGSLNNFDRLAAAANEVLNHPGLNGITGVRGVIPNIPGTAAADAQAKLNTLKSQVGFGVLQDMRNNSKTGGALGAVSDAEGKRLEANLAALENAQSVEQMRDSLKKIVEYAGSARGRVSDAYNLKHSGQAKGEQKKSFSDFGYASERDALADAQRAVKNGAPRSAVIQRLRDMGITQGAF